MTASLTLRGLTKDFKTKGRETRAIDNIDMDVKAGEFVCIVGASGCGKSTLLSIVAGLTPASAGSALLDDAPILGPGPDRGIVFQSYTLFPWRTVEENVAFGLDLAGLSKARIHERVDYYLHVMNLQKWANARPSQLSGGMRQRVAIARSLATDPEVLLLDEPFGALDANTRTAMQEYLLSIWKQTGTTVLMVTHDVEEAIFLSQRIYVLSSHPGRVRREIAIPFGDNRGPALRRDARFLDLREEIQGLLFAEITDP